MAHGPRLTGASTYTPRSPARWSRPSSSISSRCVTGASARSSNSSCRAERHERTRRSQLERRWRPMSRSIRPSTRADAAAIVALLAQAGLRPHTEPEHLDWKYWRPRSDWPGPRSFVLTEGTAPIAHAAIVPGGRVRRISAEGLEQMGGALPVSGRGTTALERSAALFAHWLACPIAPMRLYLLKRAGRVRGYFLLASAPAQVRIADCWVDSEEPADWRALIACAVAEARLDTQVAEIVGWASDPLHAGAFKACGFLAREATPVQVRPSRGSAMPPGTLRVQMLDNDAAYLHRGRNEFWT